MAYPTADELRTLVPDLADPGDFSDDLLDGLVAEFAELAEEYRGVAFIPRTATDTILVDDRTTWLRLTWPKVRSITSITVTSPAVGGAPSVLLSTTYTFDAETGHVSYPAGFACGSQAAVVYQHGLDDLTAGLVRACCQYVRSCALTDRGSTPRDVITQADGAGGYTRFSTPDWDAGRPTGYLEVDRLLNKLDDYRRISA